MYDTCIYRIELCGEADEAELNAISPLRVSIELTDSGSSLLTVCTDQSGLVGLMRHLHGLGFVFLSMQREESVPYGTLSSFPK
ncbi:MAG: hypothetical protein ACM30E_09220 [Nitrososphaerales archaeon]